MINLEISCLEKMAEYNLRPEKTLIFDGRIHRFSSSGKAKDTAGWYWLTIDSGAAFGSFGDFRAGISVNFCTAKPISETEKIEFKQKQEKYRKLRERQERELRQKAQKLAAAILDKSSDADQNHPYAARKKINPSNAKIYKGLLFVPAYQNSEICGGQFIAADGQKRFIKGTPAGGAYLALGEETPEILICEGYATGCTLQQITGCMTYIAFSAGNLAAVVEFVRKNHPYAARIICADNDESGVGLQKANEAAKKTPCAIRYPYKQGDFNDLFCEDGAAAVKDIIFPPPPPEVDYDAYQEYDEPLIMPPFTVLGRCAGRVYYMHADGFIYDYSPASHNKQTLLALADNSFWKANFPREDGDAGFYTDEAISWLLALSEHKIFDPSQRRGRGAWLDNGKIIIHQGLEIMDVSSGSSTPVTQFKGEFYYPKLPKISAPQRDALPSADAGKVLQICRLLPVADEISAYLLAGWIACAQISGILDWRPHIWITGRKGSGKSYIMNNLLLPLLGKNCLQVQSATTEAGIRQALGGDARPVLFDEAEGTGQRERDRLQRVLELARQASSEGGGVIAKGTPGGQALSFHVRSCFCFSSISSSLSQNSDKSRVTQIEIDARRYGSEDKFNKLQADATQIVTSDFCAAFYWRCIHLAEIIKKNSRVFSSAAAQFFQDRRAGDQIGTLLAGAFSLASPKEIDASFAAEWIAQQNWQSTTVEIEEQSDEDNLLTSILQSHVPFENKQKTLGELIRIAHEDFDVQARRALGEYGIKIENFFVYIANNSDNLRKCLKDTAFSDNWAKTLQRLDDAQKSAAAVRFAPGLNQRATILPLSYVL